MNKRKKVNNILQNKYMPFVLLMTLMLILHIFIQFSGDDLWFQSKLLEYEYFDFLKERYFSWTSRIIIESVLYIVVTNPIIVFRLLNVFFMLLLTLSITRLISSEMNTRISWTVVLLFLLFPFVELSSAGWAATSINYLWPAAAGVFSLIPFVKVIRGEQIRAFEYPFYIAALIFAANQEQTAALLLGFGLIFTIFIAVKDKCVNNFLIFLNIIALGGIILVILCPGNSNRTIAETETWFPEYSSLSVYFKLLLGVSNTLNYLFNVGNIFIFVLAFILLTIIIKKRIGKCATVLAFASLVFCFLTNLSSDGLRAKLFPAFNGFLARVNLQHNPYSGMVNLIPILVCCVVIGIIFIEIYLIYGVSNKSGLLLLTFCAGLSASFIIGFSPTIYASGYRIFFFLNVTLITIITMIVKYEWNCFSLRPKHTFYVIALSKH